MGICVSVCVYVLNVMHFCVSAVHLFSFSSVLRVGVFFLLAMQTGLAHFNVI